ncbi:MAG: DNA polymerase IV [Bacillota bacterium]
MSRVVLHVDFNAFYASAECLYRPEIRNFPMVVAGDPEKRHGIVLAKNDRAKAYGIKTGEPLFQARQKAPGLIAVPPNFPLYERIAYRARQIYCEYSDRVEPFGMDESYVDISGPGFTLEDGLRVADKLRLHVARETGLTVSVGIADNKVFAKLGSDMQKPDASTLITPENFKRRVWPLPADNLLYVGRVTREKLRRCGIYTIGDIAGASPIALKGLLGKSGPMLHDFANGRDRSPVAFAEDHPPAKSIGNSLTTPHDIACDQDVRVLLYLLSESVASRMRAAGLKGAVVQLKVRENDLSWFDRQKKLSEPTNLAGEIAKEALKLFESSGGLTKPLRGMGVTMTGLLPDDTPAQLSLLFDRAAREKAEARERAVDDIRRRFGNRAICRAVLLCDPEIACLNPAQEHSVCFERTIKEPAPRS